MKLTKIKTLRARAIRYNAWSAPMIRDLNKNVWRRFDDLNFRTGKQENSIPSDVAEALYRYNAARKRLDEAVAAARAELADEEKKRRQERAKAPLRATKRNSKTPQKKGTNKK